MGKINISKLKKHKLILVENIYKERFIIKIKSIFYKIDEETNKCILHYNGSWQYNDEKEHICYNATFRDLKAFVNRNDVMKVSFYTGL